TRGKFALLESDYFPLSPEGRAKLREGIDASYVDFVTKVANSRKKKFAEIEPLAQGRVWLGDQAKANGLVDELGGIDRAIELVRKKAGIPATGKVNLVLFPGKRSLLDMLFKSSSADQEAEALMSAAGLEGFRAAWHDARLKVWMKGGMLRMMPFEMSFR
ncbi:MAG TPA: S49 family peptidase, partial [Bryobacteraceae bacterium]|nr:S49 family peptidase [Bryobacteraceae bacterium]